MAGKLGRVDEREAVAGLGNEEQVLFFSEEVGMLFYSCGVGVCLLTEQT